MAFGGGCGAFRPAFSLKRAQSAAGEIEIGEREEREHLRAVLGDAPIADLAVAELAFQHPEQVLDSARTLPKRRFLARWRCVRSRPGFAFSFTPHNTPAASAARFFSSLA